MESILSILRRKLDEYPESKSLRVAISHLSQVETRTTQSQEITQDVVRHEFDTLRAEGLWESSPENDRLLEDALRTFANRDGSHSSSMSPTRASSNVPSNPGSQDISEGRRDISIVMPPPISAPLLPVSSVNTTLLPMELVEVLNHVYFLHLLATNPQSVLPPGKSLLSVMLRPHAQSHQAGELPNLRDRVEDLVHRAFWDEALESLSNPSPAVQLPRLKRLYEDLYVALKPLLPADHPLLVTFSSPLSPTSSPLRSAITHLREVLASLRERCAPARDAQLDTLIRAVDNVSSVAALSDTAKLVVDTMRSILKLSGDMADDLSQFVLGSMGEDQLRAVLIDQAHKGERDLVLELWRPHQVEEDWRKWLDGPASSQDLAAEHNSHHAWAHRLVQALGSTVPVSCPLPTVILSSSSDQEEAAPAGNLLPPPLFFVCPTLLHIQNYLQALVIAASLRSLVRLAPSSDSLPTTQPNTLNVDSGSFISRIWALLKAEVDEEPGSGDTKLLNLADEVIRVRRQSSGSDETINAEEEVRLRAAVDRTLQTSDPVFQLLQKRLLQTISTRLAHPLETSSQPEEAHLPERLQTGHERPGNRHKVTMNIKPAANMPNARERVREPPLVVKGFEDAVLVDAILEVLTNLRSCLDWTEQVWADLIQTGKLRVGLDS